MSIQEKGTAIFMFDEENIKTLGFPPLKLLLACRFQILKILQERGLDLSVVTSLYALTLIFDLVIGINFLNASSVI